MVSQIPTVVAKKTGNWNGALQVGWRAKEVGAQAPEPWPGRVCGVDEHGERTYTDKDGVEFFWDATKSAWFPKIDDDFMARYQMNYGFIDNTSAGEKEKAEKEAAEAKRKEEELKRMTAEAEAAMSRDNPASSAAVPTGKRKAQEPPSTRYSTFRLISYDF